MFDEPIKNNYSISVDSWYTDRKVVNDGLEFQIDISSAQNLNSPKYLMVTHQPPDRINISTEERNIAVFDNLDVKKYIREIDGQTHRKDVVLKLNK